MTISKIKFPMDYQQFRDKLEKLINECCMEIPSNTPDYILADLLTATLMHHDIAVARTRKSKR